MAMRSVVSSRLKAVGLHTLAQVITIHSVAGNWTAERVSHGNVTTKIFIGNKSRNKEAEAARKRFGLGDEENMLLNIGSHGCVPTKTFIGNKSRNKEVEAARKKFELGDVINMLNDIGSHDDATTKTLTGNVLSNKEVEAHRKRTQLGGKTNMSVDKGSHDAVATKTLTGNMLRNKGVEAPRKRSRLGDKTNMLVDIVGSHDDVTTKTLIGNMLTNKEAEAPRKRARLGDKTSMLVDKDSQGNVATKTFIGNKSRNKDAEGPRKIFSLTDRTKFLVHILLRLKDSKEAVYGALDSFAACEEKFPLTILKRALYQLEQKQQWHRIIQVIKWILSKGQAMTMETYEQLLCALDKDCRAEEAHTFWDKRIGSNLFSVPWQMCASMIYIYQRNNMPENLIKLFNDLEMQNWKPPDKAVIKKVADTYEILGLHDEQERVLKKYESLFTASSKTGSKKKKGKRS